MTTRIIEIDDLDRAEKEILSIGSERAGALLMAPKALFRVIKLKAVRSPAANIIKQEMLALGGEAATAYGAINCSIKSSDILIFGTVKQLNLLIGKLKPHVFGLPAIAEQISAALHNYETIPKPIKIRHRTLDFGHRTYIMGILNVTPDSFSDGGKFAEVDRAAAHAKQMIADGADILDIGGESTRPGAQPVSVREELERVLPIIEGLRGISVPLSVDTCKPEVMRAAIAAGVHMVNDINALQDAAALDAVAASGVAVCLMHKQGNPQTMQQQPHYQNVVVEVCDFLRERLATAEAAGIARERIVIDPGFGFGKTLAHNLNLLRHLGNLRELGVPVMAGLSRKSMLGAITGQDVNHRASASIAAALIAVQHGASIVRVHDVRETVDALKIWNAINESE